MDTESIIRILRANLPRLREYHVRSLAIFGSVVRGEARPESDIDILVEFEPGARVGLFSFARLQEFLEEILGRRVDLVMPDGLDEPLRELILREAVYAV